MDIGPIQYNTRYNLHNDLFDQGFKAEVSREPTDIRVKLPQPPSALPQQYQQVGQPLVRKQTTQQYLEVRHT